jgi:NADH dehydrogenase/NADH:ubiquinone oxidoreductase subunit G
MSNSEACAAYDAKIAALSEILESQKAQIAQVSTLAKEIQAIKMTPPPAKPKQSSAAMKAAIAEAQAAGEKFGKSSSEAILAWETVEEIASSDNSVVVGATLDEECLVEAIESCNALEELSRVINLEKNSDGAYSG